MNSHHPQPDAHRMDTAARVASATLTYLAPPADPLLGALLEVMPPGQVLAVIRAGSLPSEVARGLTAGQATRPGTLVPAGAIGCLSSRRTLVWTHTRSGVSA